MADVERAVARMFAVGFPGTSVSSELKELIARGVGGAVLFRRNFSDGQQVADLCAELKAIAGRPFLICVDQEGGRVIRFGEPFTQVPAMRLVGERGNTQTARRIGQLLARELRAANVDMDLAPVLDVDTNPANPVIADRALGRDPARVALLGTAMIEGMQAEGVAACGKHFPGHGDTAQDSHHDLPRLPHGMQRLDAVELQPFREASRAGVAAIMTAHVVFEAIDAQRPATMSRAVLTGLLREQIGFTGVIVSDDLGMKAVAAHYSLEDVVLSGANAGVDLYLMAQDPAVQHRAIDLLVRAVERGDVSRETIDAANRRLDVLFQRYVKDARRGPLSEVVGCEAHRRLVLELGEAQAGIDPTAYEGNR